MPAKRSSVGAPMSNAKVVFVTGVCAWVGCAAAEQFAPWGRTDVGSVRDDIALQRSVQNIIGRANRIDVLAHNVGGTLLGAVEETSVSEAQALSGTNMFGPLRVGKEVVPHMREQRAGRIVNVSSVLGFLAAHNMGLSSATKHAVEGESEAMDSDRPGIAAQRARRFSPAGSVDSSLRKTFALS